MEPVGRVCEERQVSGGGPGCVKTRAFNCSQKVLLNLVNLKTKSTGDGYPRKAIKKAVLRFLGSRTFSHGLAPKRSPPRCRLIDCPLRDPRLLRIQSLDRSEGDLGSAALFDEALVAYMDMSEVRMRIPQVKLDSACGFGGAAAHLGDTKCKTLR
jgi:hypothetical protein